MLVNTVSADSKNKNDRTVRLPLPSSSSTPTTPPVRQLLASSAPGARSLVSQLLLRHLCSLGDEVWSSPSLYPALSFSPPFSIVACIASRHVHTYCSSRCLSHLTMLLQFFKNFWKCTEGIGDILPLFFMPTFDPFLFLSLSYSVALSLTLACFFVCSVNIINMFHHYFAMADGYNGLVVVERTACARCWLSPFWRG